MRIKYQPTVPNSLNSSLTNENSETFNFGVKNGVRGFFTNPSRADDSFIPFSNAPKAISIIEFVCNYTRGASNHAFDSFSQYTFIRQDDGTYTFDARWDNDFFNIYSRTEGSSLIACHLFKKSAKYLVKQIFTDHNFTNAREIYSYFGELPADYYSEWVYVNNGTPVADRALQVIYVY